MTFSLASKQRGEGSNSYIPPVDTLSGADFELGVAQNWAQFFVSEKPEDGNSLKIDGEPPRNRTWNPQIKSLLLYQLS